MKLKKIIKAKFRVYVLLSLVVLFVVSCNTEPIKDEAFPSLKVSDNKHYIADQNGNPFFWLGDTGWLLFKNLKREEVEEYLEDRKQKGFNVIQVMVVHDINNAVNIYGDSALINNNIATINTTNGSNPSDEVQYDYWDHIDYTIKLAEKKGIYMALVPIWGSNIKGGGATVEEAKVYASFLANRYKDQSNIIWLNGGDIKGTDSLNIWKTIGNTINQIDTNHLITFHPFGRTKSSDWFHNEKWVDFNMFQSGHRSYEQDDTERAYGQDNWRYVETDYKLQPIKPTLDGEPSYENIPQGLHDTLQPKWNDSDARRYAYWSVFAGACGHTYGHNSVMQFFQPDSTGNPGAYGARLLWKPALDAPGACQMRFLKDLLLSKAFFDRIPDQSLIAENQGERYEYLIATRGSDYAFIYTYTGRNMKIKMGKITGEKVKASWYKPTDGTISEIGEYENSGSYEFDPPGEQAEGNDWVLILDSL